MCHRNELAKGIFARRKGDEVLGGLFFFLFSSFVDT